jgi:hypothetical protein
MSPTVRPSTIEQAALGVGVDDGHRATAGALGFHGEVGAQGGFSGPAFLGGNRQYVHVY